ncbi:hypothetical protein [Streptomyces sp. H27-H5]|uniref:hypothetical protein n=1 Tax=Streptomyces sp. H27-H5 TaxID=2996460 RepID=UPI002270763F|nr:hypothetical protein [Streptomyces sp. H27-H5]MCY0960829.1 hypothetical protein [Streptomyces sp. H27-H5]
MHRETRFLISRKPYAIDLDSLTVAEPGPRGSVWAGVSAVWFRRRRGVTVACTGTLRDLQDTTPADVHAFLAAHTDGRYGGTAHGRWDGERYWGAQEPFQMALDLTVLEPMLAAYPDVPPGYDGWWTFQPA